MSFGYQTLINSRSSRQCVGTTVLMTLAGFAVGVGSSGALAQQSTIQGNTTNTTVNSTGNHTSQSQVSGKVLKPKFADGPAVNYVVEHPGWRISKAVRVVDPNQPRLNIVKTVFARIAVGVESEEALKAAINVASTTLGSNRPGSHSYESFLNSPGVYVIQANSVENAIELANEIAELDGVLWAEVDHQGQVENRSITADPSAADQWHVRNTIAGFTGRDHKIDLVYDLGITGAGVVVGVLEADANPFFHVDEFGTSFIHPDLANKLSMELSIPTDPFNISYSHGVSVAGLIGAEGDNGLAGSGVAHGSTLVSLRNGSGIDSGASFGHELQEIDIINNSWGPVTVQSFPPDNTGKVLVALPDDFEILVPEIIHAGMARLDQIGIDQGHRLGRGRDGRIYVFASGNSNHFQGFDRLALGNAISLPGVGMDDANVPSYGYLDITGTSTAGQDDDGIPDAFLMNGMTTGTAPSGEPTAMGWRWSGHMGERLNYSELNSGVRMFNIAAVGMSNAHTGYSTTGCSILASAYVQDSVLGAEFTPPPNSGWFGVSGQGVTTLEQPDGVDSDIANTGVDCNTIFGTTFVDPDLEECMFNGTSAASPIAAGIIALMLEANPSLTLRDVQHIIQQTSTVVNYDPTSSYWPSVILGSGPTDPDDTGPLTPGFWTTNRAGVRHSDEYGFGIIDAQAAVTAAQTWTNVPRLHILDSGLITEGDEGRFQDGIIPDATFDPYTVLSVNVETNVLTPGIPLSIPLACVRENFTIEGVELTVNITGDGAGDLYIALRGPYGTVSPLALPRGDSNGLNTFAYFDYTLSSFKHWGELSGGFWSLDIVDFRPDVESPEGTLPTDPLPSPPEPEDFGLEQITYLGAFGLPGNANHSQKQLVSYELKIYGTDNGTEIFEGCPLLQTSCPGDLDGNGIVDVTDLQIFINWFLEGNPLADVNGDGNINFTDVVSFRAIWTPGFCSSINDPFIGGRPRPGSSGSTNDPVIHPI